MAFENYEDRAAIVIGAAIELARSSGSLGPVHLLVALSEDDGPAAGLLRPRDGSAGLRAVLFANVHEMNSGVHFDYLARQVIGSAEKWAADELKPVSPEHLLVALVEQSNPDVVEICVKYQVSLGESGGLAAQTLRWSNDHRPVLVGLPAAGTMDRPPLPLGELPDGVWTALCQRQDRLPFTRVRHTWHWEAIQAIEARVAWRLATKHNVTNDLRYSLMHHHCEAVRRLAAVAIPALASPLVPSKGMSGIASGGSIGGRRRRRVVPSGWICWVGNRISNARRRWLRLIWRY